MRPFSRFASVAVLGMAALIQPAQAGLFDDDEARKAILDLRQKLEQSNEQNRLKQAELNAQLLEQIMQIKRSLLELNTQFEALRTDNAKLRGQDEELARALADLQRRMKDTVQVVDDRFKRFEPQKVTLDGAEFLAEPEEKRLYDDAIALIRKSDFAGAAGALAAFRKRYPTSGYGESALFWMGNANYGKRDYKEAIASFRALIAANPEGPKAPEALLSIANCQVELKDIKGARRSIDELLKNYPKSEAAQAGRERLASLK